MSERVERLERLMAMLVSALLRQGTDQDGDWGWPSTRETAATVLAELGVDMDLKPVTPNPEQKPS